jgi:hypothetical protein
MIDLSVNDRLPNRWEGEQSVFINFISSSELLFEIEYILFYIIKIILENIKKFKLFWK